MPLRDACYIDEKLTRKLGNNLLIGAKPMSAGCLPTIS
jgi:hypothetical protein